MNNTGKYQLICDQMEEVYPVLANVWKAAHDNFGDEWLDEFIINVETIYGEITPDTDTSLQDALDGYAEFCIDSMRNQSYFVKHGRYRATSYAEALENFYNNEDHMTRCYLPGQYLSHFLWPQHYFMLHGFRNVILPRVKKGLFFEVGVGCGMYSKVTLENSQEWRGVGFDISQYSLDFTKVMLDRFGLGDRYTIRNRDICKGSEEKCDLLICQEVLEHLENPADFCQWLYDMVTPGGKAYITAALNAAHSDHIYLFTEPSEVEVMLRDAGFQPFHSQEEYAAGYKPRKVTPSLLGYLCERPA